MAVKVRKVHAPALQANVLAEGCRFADSRFSNVVPEWEMRSLQDRGRRLGRVLGVLCIRRVRRLPAVPLEWARPAWLRRECRERARQDDRVRHRAVRVSDTFRAG